MKSAPSAEHLLFNYINNRKFPFPLAINALYNWIGRVTDFRNSFSHFNSRLSSCSRDQHKYVIGYIRRYRLSIIELEDYVLNIEMIKSRASYRNTFITRFGLLLAASISLFSYNSNEKYITLIGMVSVIFGIFSIFILSESIYIHKYKAAYEELIVMLKREIKYLEPPKHT